MVMVALAAVAWCPPARRPRPAGRAARR